jgi:hypothetical protein
VLSPQHAHRPTALLQVPRNRRFRIWSSKICQPCDAGGPHWASDVHAIAAHGAEHFPPHVKTPSPRSVHVANAPQSTAWVATVHFRRQSFFPAAPTAA